MPNGPYVQIATFCKNTVRSKEGNNLSIIDCVNTIAPAPSQPPVEGQVAILITDFTLALSVWAGELRGNYMLTVRPEPPSGEPLADNSLPVSFVGDGGLIGVDLEMQYAGPLTESGLYWFSVLISGGPDDGPERLVTKIPLEVRL